MSARALKIGMAVVGGLLALSIPKLAAPKGAPHAASLCAPDEERFFSCKTRAQKFIALCQPQGRPIEYRFGTPTKIELSYPKSKGDPALRFASYSRAQTERMEVTFSVGGADYAVYDYEEEGRREAGVRATLANGKEVNIPCKGAITSRLAELEKLLPCDPDNALNLGSCPHRAP